MVLFFSHSIFYLEIILTLRMLQCSLQDVGEAVIGQETTERRRDEQTFRCTAIAAGRTVGPRAVPVFSSAVKS